jgi:MFS family permease
LLGGWLAQERGFKFMLVIAAVLYILATILRVGMARRASRSPEARAQKLSLASLKENLGTMFGLVTSGGVLTWVLITDGVRDISFALSFNFMPIYMEEIAHLSLQQIGLMNSIFSLLVMLTTIPGGWLADRKGERVGIVTGFFMIFVALMLFVSTINFWLYCLGWAIAGAGVGLMSPAYQSLISKAVPARLRGTAFGLFSTSLGLVSLPAPALGAQLWERVSPRFPFQITAWVSLLSMIPAWLKFKLNGDERKGDV